MSKLPVRAFHIEVSGTASIVPQRLRGFSKSSRQRHESKARESSVDRRIKEIALNLSKAPGLMSFQAKK
jgi:hypothetical protein